MSGGINDPFSGVRGDRRISTLPDNIPRFNMVEPVNSPFDQLTAVGLQ